MTFDELEHAIVEVKGRTDQPFGVNLRADAADTTEHDRAEHRDEDRPAAADRACLHAGAAVGATVVRRRIGRRGALAGREVEDALQAVDAPLHGIRQGRVGRRSVGEGGVAERQAVQAVLTTPMLSMGVLFICTKA